MPRLQKDSGQSVSLGIQMAPTSCGVRLVREIDWQAKSTGKNSKLRPLSPVRFRHKPQMDVSPPTLRSLKQRNERNARSSPFISHLDRKQRESWLFRLGSVSKPNDPYLCMEMDLQSQLSKIISPIKKERNPRLYGPPKNRSPQSVNAYLAEKSINSSISNSYGSHNGFKSTNTTQSLILPHLQDKTSPNKNQQHMKGASNNNRTNSNRANNNSINDNDVERGGESENLNNIGDISPPRILAPSPNYAMMGEAYDGEMGLVPLNIMYNETTHAPFNPQNTMIPDTPVSDLSDLDSRSRRSQVYSAGSHLTNASGIYGDFEDDLISTGSVNEDEFIL